MGSEPLLSVHNISKKFGGVLALSTVSLDVFRGDIVGIIGPNGSGKTTMVNAITGFIRADSGTVHFDGRNITNWQPHKIAAEGLTRTFQVMRPYFSLPAYKNLIVPLFSPGLEKQEDGEAAARWAVEIQWLLTFLRR